VHGLKAETRMNLIELEEAVAQDLAANQADVEDAHLDWEEYAEDMWTERKKMFARFPSKLSFISWRALVRRAAASLGPVS
jgi:hypothetical protein